jgi:hypothetical protein
MPSNPTPDRGLRLAVAVVAARRAGVNVDLADLLDNGQSPLELVSGTLQIIGLLLDAQPDDGRRSLARIGLIAARSSGDAAA